MLTIPQSTTKSTCSSKRSVRGNRSAFAGFQNPKANFTLTPNQFYDIVMFGPYKPGVKVVVAAVIRYTLGWEDPDTGERRLEAGLSLTDFMACGLSRQTARESIDGAIEAGFIIQTAAATTHSSARYAIRCSDAGVQIQAIQRQRKAHGGLRRRGGSVTIPCSPRRISRGLKIRPLEIDPPIYKDSERNLNSEKKEESKKQTLNVGEQVNFVAPQEAPEVSEAEKVSEALEVSEAAPVVHAAAAPAVSEAAPEEANSPEGMISRAVRVEAERVVAELRDWGSERRHRQLLAICDQHRFFDLPQQALWATRARLARETQCGVLEKPGAYYVRVLLKMLADRQVFVPTAAEKAETPPEKVRRLARESLGLPPISPRDPTGDGGKKDLCDGPKPLPTAGMSYNRHYRPQTFVPERRLPRCSINGGTGACLLEDE